MDPNDHAPHLRALPIAATPLAGWRVVRALWDITIFLCVHKVCNERAKQKTLKKFLHMCCLLAACFRVLL